jgi:hypothetical protein
VLVIERVSDLVTALFSVDSEASVSSITVSHVYRSKISGLVSASALTSLTMSFVSLSMRSDIRFWAPSASSIVTSPLSATLDSCSSDDKILRARSEDFYVTVVASFEVFARAVQLLVDGVVDCTFSAAPSEDCKDKFSTFTTFFYSSTISFGIFLRSGEDLAVVSVG